MVATHRGKSYAQRKAEADSRATKLIQALRSSGKTVKGVNNRNVAEQEGIKYTGSSSTSVINKVAESSSFKNNRLRSERQEERDLFIQKTAEQERQIKQEQEQRQARENWSPSSVYTDKYKYSPESLEKIIKPIRNKSGKIIGYLDSSAKKSVVAPKGFNYSEEDIRKANVEYSAIKKAFPKKQPELRQDNEIKRIINIQPRFDIDKRGGLAGEINIGINKGINKVGKKYYELVQKVREKKDFIYPGMILPAKGRFPKQDKLISKHGEEVVSSTLNFGTYVVPYVGVARMALDVTSAGVSLTKKETYSAIKADPLNAGIQYGSRALELAVLSKSGYDKFINPKTVNLKKITEEFDLVRQGKLKLQAEIIGFQKPTIRLREWNVKTHQSIKFVDELTGHATVGTGKGQEIKFLDVFSKKGSMTRYVTLKNDARSLLKIDVNLKGAGKYTYYFKGKIVQQGAFTSKFDHSKLGFSKVVEQYDMKLGYNLKTPTKIQKFKGSDYSIYDVIGENAYFKISIQNQLKKVIRVQKKARIMKYDTVMNLKKGKYTNPVVSRKTLKTSIDYGSPIANSDKITSYIILTDKQQKVMLETAIRQPRIKSSYFFKQTAEIKYGSIQVMPKTYLFSSPVPTPLLSRFSDASVKIKVPTLKSNIKSADFGLIAGYKRVGVLGSKATSINVLSKSKSLFFPDVSSFVVSRIDTRQEEPSVAETKIFSEIIVPKTRTNIGEKNKIDYLTDQALTLENVFKTKQKNLFKTTKNVNVFPAPTINPPNRGFSFKQNIVPLIPSYSRIPPYSQGLFFSNETKKKKKKKKSKAIRRTFEFAPTVVSASLGLRGKTPKFNIKSGLGQRYLKI